MARPIAGPAVLIALAAHPAAGLPDWAAARWCADGRFSSWELAVPPPLHLLPVPPQGRCWRSPQAVSSWRTFSAWFLRVAAVAEQQRPLPRWHRPVPGRLYRATS